MEQIASFEFPESTISGLIKDLAGQGTVDALRALRAGLHETAGESINYLMQSGNPVLEGLGDKLYELVPDSGTDKVSRSRQFLGRSDGSGGSRQARHVDQRSYARPRSRVRKLVGTSLSAPANPRMPGN